MFKAYQFKWYFILAGILTISSLLLRQGHLNGVGWWEFLYYTFQISSTLFVGWLIHGYFLTHTFASVGLFAKHFLSNVLSILSLFALAYIFYRFLPKTILIEESVPFNTVSNIIIHLTGAFFISIICYVVFYSVHANSALQASKLENEILEQAHLRAQLLSLQQQISPHFLFNSLSTLKTIANDQPTKSYVIQLAVVYRYVLNFNEHYLTPLKDELTFIRSYLYILNQRFEEALQVNINVPDEYLHLLIPPLSLQLLVENAVKHNTISPDKPLYISILADDSPALIVKNNFQPKKVKEDGTGTGLNNIRERYRLLVHKTVQITNDQLFFSVTLPLLKK